MALYEFWTSRNNSVANTAAYVGKIGRLFYDNTDGILKISDGHTPGGVRITYPPATTTTIGGIKAGPGANVGVDGTLTIDTTGLPLSIGNLSFVDTTISVATANQNLILATNGSGNVDLVGNVNFHTTASPNSNPLFSVDNFGNVIVNGRLNVIGQSYFIGNETNFGNIVINGQTTFNGATIINGDTTRTGNTIQSGAVTITGNAINNGYSTFNGNTTFNGDVVHTGNINITGVTTNNGLSVFNGDLTIAGNARIVGNTSITGNTLVTGQTTVTGNTLVTGTTTVVGNTLVTGNTTVTGNTLVTGQTTVTGNTLVTGITTVIGQTYLTGNSYVTGNTSVTGTTTVTGNTYVTGQVTTITGNTYLQGNSFVTGTISITGNSVQTGLATFIVSTPNASEGAVEITGDITGNSQTLVNPGGMLHITGQYSLPSRVFNDGQNNYPTYVGRRFNGNVTTPTQVLNNQDVVRFGGTAYTSTGWQGNGIARISMLTNEDQTSTNQGSRIEFWLTPNGNSSSNIANVVVLTSSTMSVNANVAIGANSTLTTPRVILNDGGVRQLTGNTAVTLDFSTDSMVSLTNPTNAVTITLANYTAGAIIRFIYSSATARTINLGVAAAVNSTTGGTTLLSTGPGAPIGNNQSVILTYYCVGGTAATTYVSASYV